MKYIITESQYKLLNEDLPISLRRRLSSDWLRETLDYGVLEHMDPCDFDYPGEYISEACDILKDIILEDTDNVNIAPSDRDNLYNTLVDMFSDYLSRYHKNNKCY
jgi:hypothetical protein